MKTKAGGNVEEEVEKQRGKRKTKRKRKEPDEVEYRRREITGGAK